ncbi:MAG TPA: class I SAM-dependent methyltransferase, partial [Chitinophagaceae bacterium]|nr:class I SAM-dependent methyltransferase [Chitinophagaceae bacterium]
GRVTRHLQRRLLPGTRLIASDVSESMLQQAKKQLHAATIQWQFIDAQNIGLPENSIDLVVCAFGYMFVENKEKAMAEAYRVLKPGGSLLFTTWSKLEENAASHTSMLLAAEYLGIPIPASSLVATSMHNEKELKMLLATAGFSAITTEKVQLFSVTSTAREAAAGFVKGGTLYKEIAQRFPEQIPSITLALENALAQKFGAAPMVAPISAIISRGWKK